jgi:transcriptional regulator with XRE-family HTH domain
MLAVASLPHDLGAYLREQRQSARLSLRQLAEVADVSNPYLSQIERGLKKPSAEILQQLAKGLRISAESLYVRAGMLEERDLGQVSLQAAILAEPVLSERQKRVLLDIYESVRAENARAATSDPDQADPPADDGLPQSAQATEPTRPTDAEPTLHLVTGDDADQQPPAPARPRRKRAARAGRAAGAPAGTPAGTPSSTPPSSPSSTDPGSTS